MENTVKEVGDVGGNDIGIGTIEEQVLAILVILQPI
jgi:hypothetical protein